MDIDILLLNETVSTRLTTLERGKLSKLVAYFDTTKSELIRLIVVKYLQSDQFTNQLLNAKKTVK